jgi:hypothetical protein
VWTYSGPDDGGAIQWWDCETHGTQGTGGEWFPPSFPCEGWLNELADEGTAAEIEREAN